MAESKIILVTGGAGFIGSNLCHYLIAHHIKVLCLDNFDVFYSEKIKMNNVKLLLNHNLFELIKGDIQDDILLDNIFKRYQNQINTVIHLAAKAGVRNSMLHPVDYFDVNVKGSLILLEAMKKNGVKNLIFASSSSVYGDKNGKLSENDACNEQISPYAASKKATELLNYNYHINYNMNIINLRLFSVYGQNQRPDLVIYKFFSQILQNKPIEIYGYEDIKRDYTHVNDVVAAIYNSILYLEIQNKNIYEIINIGNDKPISMSELLEYIKKIIKTENISYKIKDLAKGDVKITHADIQKAKKMLNYSPTISFYEGINMFYEWFLNYRILTY